MLFSCLGGGNIRGNDFKNHGINTVIKTGQRNYTLTFCFETFANAERIHREIYNKDYSINKIIEDLSDNFISALHSVVYGALAVNSDMDFRQYLETIGTKENELLLKAVAFDGLNQMFYEHNDTGTEPDDSPAEFAWDTYYKLALNLGFSDADFWASTPKKLYLLVRDKEEEAQQEWLTKTFI